MKQKKFKHYEKETDSKKMIKSRTPKKKKLNPFIKRETKQYYYKYLEEE